MIILKCYFKICNSISESLSLPCLSVYHNIAYNVQLQSFKLWQKLSAHYTGLLCHALLSVIFLNAWFRRKSLILINGRELWDTFYFHLQWFYLILHLNKLLHKKTIWDLLRLPWSASLHSTEYDPFTELLITSMLSFWSLNDPIMPGSICK